MKLTMADGVRTLTTTRTYDANGNQTLVMDAEGNLTQYESMLIKPLSLTQGVGARSCAIDDKSTLIETMLLGDTSEDLSDNVIDMQLVLHCRRSRLQHNG